MWLGGLLFQGVVSAPVLLMEAEEFRRIDEKMRNRFAPFVWTSIWTILATGFIMMLLSPRFVWFEYETTWAKLLLGKQVCYVVMLGLTVSSDRAWKRVKALGQVNSGGGSTSLIEEAKRKFVRSSRRNVVFAILALLFAAGLDVY